MPSELSPVLDYLRRLCSAREYCSKDIYDKALKRLEDPRAAADAVKTLADEGFLSDSRYAAAYARDKSSIAGWGPVKIRFMLRSKGIPADTIEAALEGIDPQRADTKLAKIISAKYKLLKQDPQVRIKLLKFALSRGYGYEQVNKVVSEILDGKNENLQ